ncbi:hypothetical protein Bca52824_064914 [Brassica carinata]|uniref:DUF4283 domain-containing protein n=1 Tax=Brassica carinata TaxID=52824 RepID=A0A8X7U9H4_BRACI|nr:hypothetical protein Bca52824_064914 [Brassica carinata]
MGSSFRMKSSHHADIKGKGISYEDDDAPIKLELGLTLIGKVLNPKKQNVEKLLQTMPAQWGLAERITANDLGNGKFLFNFSNVEDLNYVMAKGPFHYNFCMFVLVRWEPIVHDDYPWIIPFWVQLIGFPLHLWTDTNLKNIGRRIGYVDTIELTEGRMLIDVDTRRPLKFSRKVEYEGDEVTIEIKYDKLFKHCTICGMLSHEKGYCPSIEALQPSLERSDVFTRVQLPVRQSARDTQGNDRNYHQSSLMKREMYTRNSQAYKARPDMRNRIGESKKTTPGHGGRIEFKRSDRYGGGRARTGPYDRNDGRSWRVKPKLNNATDSEQNGNGVANKRNEIVPYEHFLGAGSHDPLISGNDLSSREENKEDTSGTRKLASAIVTPSRVRSSENVTIIGALSDMDLVDQLDSGLMDTDANEDDLLGDELMEMEGDALLNAERANGDEKKKAKHKRLVVSLRSSVGALQVKERLGLVHLHQRELTRRANTGQVHEKSQTGPKVMVR